MNTFGEDEEFWKLILKKYCRFLETTEFLLIGSSLTGHRNTLRWIIFDIVVVFQQSITVLWIKHYIFFRGPEKLFPVKNGSPLRADHVNPVPYTHNYHNFEFLTDKLSSNFCGNCCRIFMNESFKNVATWIFAIFNSLLHVTDNLTTHWNHCHGQKSILFWVDDF